MNRRIPWLLVLSAVFGAFLTLLAWHRVAVLPYQVDYGEGLMLEGALRITQSQPLYPPPSGLPVVIHVYGPVAYAITAATVPFSGLSFFGGRILMLLCALCISLLLFIMLRRFTTSIPLALAFAFLILTIPAFRFWLCLLRADLIGIALSLAGIALYAARPRLALWTVPFFAAALFSKYTLLAAPFAVFLHLFLQKNYKSAGRFAGLLALSSAGFFFLLQSNTSGAFAFHMFSTHPDPYSLKQFLLLAALVALSAPVVTTLALYHLRRSLYARDFNLPSLYFFTASLATVTAGKLGSTTNHFLEWMVAACLCAGIAFATISTRHPRRFLQITVLLAISILAASALQTYHDSHPEPELTQCPAAYDYVAHSNATRILSQSLGPLLINRKPVSLTDPFVYGQLVEHGIWSDQTLVTAIDARSFDLIITTVDPARIPSADSIWPPSLLDAMARQYRVAQRFACRDGSLMLEPRP